jgi:hypothetical protein
MNTFVSLLKVRKGKPPADAQKRARLDFPGLVAQSKLVLRQACATMPASGEHFIIGIATYAANELDLLDQLEDALQGRAAAPPDVEVFDVLDCQTPSDFRKFIPGMDAVHRTPVIGVIADGKLIDQATGLAEVASALRRFRVLDQS